MSININGCANVAAGHENYEQFTTRIGRKSVKSYQYDYRTPNGELFSCVRSTLEACRKARDAWLIVRGQ